MHVISDNSRIREKNGARLAAHLIMPFRFAPTSARWLNRLEIWFGILSRAALRGAAFRAWGQPRQAIEGF